MITKKLIIIFLLIIALIIILIKKHKNKKVEIEHFILNLDIQEENDYDNIVSTYYNNNNIHVPIINTFGIVETNNIDIQKDINSSNITFNNLNSKELNTNIFNTKDATIKNINSSDNIENTTDNYNKFTKLNIEDINTNTITNSNNTTFKNMTILDNLNIANNNFTDSTMYINSLCFENNKCFDKSIFNDINKLDVIKQQYSSPLYQYMYLPNSRNTNGSIINDNNLIWKDIKNEITPNNNADGKIKTLNATWAMDYNTYNWNGKCIYVTNTGYGNQNNGTGIEIRVPEHPNKAKGEDYTVLWVQTLGERWSTFRVYQYDTTTNQVVKYFHKHASGLNNLNKISPDGSTHSELWNAFEWTPVPIDLTGNTLRKLVISNYYSTYTWFSGFAFSTNPWNHYKCHALEIHWGLHSEPNIRDAVSLDATVRYNINSSSNIGFSQNFNNQPVAILSANNKFTIRIPFINNSKDKILYVVEYNNEWGPSLNKIVIYDNVTNIAKDLGNLSTAFKNPFATHYNSKIWQRYYGVIIPKEYLPTIQPKNNNYIKIEISTSSEFNINEIGTHDVSPF
jgi:hypothetical protein